MPRKTCLVASLSLIISVLFAGNALALYSWVDDKGQYHISDSPKPVKQQEKEITETAKPKEDTAPIAEAEKTVQPAPSGTAMRPEQPIAPQPKPDGSSAAGPATQAVPRGGAAQVSPEQPRAIPPGIAAKLNVPNENASLAFLAAFLSTFLIVFVAAYLYGCLCMFLIAKKLNVPAAWLAWVPILQVWPFLGSAGKPLWWVLLFFIPVVNFFVICYLWMCIVENLDGNKWLGLLMLVPIVNAVYLGVLAFSSTGGRTSPGTAAY